MPTPAILSKLRHATVSGWQEREEARGDGDRREPQSPADAVRGADQRRREPVVAMALIAMWATGELPGQQGFAFGPGTAPRIFAVLLAICYAGRRIFS